MTPTVEPDVRVFDDALAVGAAAAAWVAAELASSVSSRGRASLVLSGGSTPRMLYQLLGTKFKELVPWPQVHVFWGDERYVPHDDARSNYRLAKEMLLDQIAIPAARVHPMPTDFAAPPTAARAYESTLADYFSSEAPPQTVEGPASRPPVFDVVVLGIGDDGHTASVFPGSTAMTSTHTVMAVTAPVEPPSRLTLTLPVLAAARHIGVLVTGRSKARALAAALAAEAETPAAVLARTAQTAVWWVDRDAADMRDQGAARDR